MNTELAETLTEAYIREVWRNCPRTSSPRHFTARFSSTGHWRQSDPGQRDTPGHRQLQIQGGV